MIMALKKNVFVLYCLLCLAPANTHGADVNGASFADAGNGRVDYHLAAATATGDCHGLVSLTDFNHSVISAKTIPADDNSSAHCEIHGVITPEIQYVVNLPEQWNGRLYMIGNGGFGGQSVYGDYAREDRAKARRLGFATVFTNTGHTDDAHFASWAHNNIQKEIDYGLSRRTPDGRRRKTIDQPLLRKRTRLFLL